MFDLWKRAELGFLERKIFSMFRKLQECFVKLLKIVTVLYVGKMSTTFKKRKKKIHKERLTQGLNRVKQLQG